MNLNIAIVIIALVILLPITALSQEEEKFFMVVKIEQEPLSQPDRTQFKVTKITTNLKDYQGKEVRYNLEDSMTIFWTSNDSMFLNQPIQTLDTSTPGVVKTKSYTTPGLELDLYTMVTDENGNISMPKESYEVEFNTLNNITTYRASSPLKIDGEIFLDDVNATAIVYPNRTGVLELKETAIT